MGEAKEEPKQPASSEQPTSSDPEPKKEEPKKEEPKKEEPKKEAPPPPPKKEEKPAPPKEEKKPAASEGKQEAKGIDSPFGKGSRNEDRVKMNRMRLRIAERLKQSQNTAASLTTFNEVDMSNIMEFRKRSRTKS